MKKIINYAAQLLVIICSAVPLFSLAQNGDKEFYGRPSYWNPYDQRGINRFETSKAADTLPFEGLRIRFGAGFTQQFQNLKHENKLAANNTTTNRLFPLQSGFMTAQANLVTDVQLADGIRLNVTTYLSGRRHTDTWVKGGYIQFDKLPFKGQFWNKLMDIATIKVGHMEINYGDQHFRRSDGGQTIQNPFMDNYIVDAFTTEIGGEVYLQKNGFFGMLGMTGGMIKGSVDSATKGTIVVNGVTTIIDANTRRNPSIILKGGYDKSLAERVRVRVSGSLYTNSSSAATGLTLYNGDRTGSNYQNVMEKVPAGTAIPSYDAIPVSGRLNPGFTKKVTAVMLNGFLKMQGLEIFGTYETAKGRTKTETSDRNMTQLAGEAIYRFGKAENLYVGTRYNTVKVQLANIANDVKVNRFALAGGWFVTRNVLMKAEYVIQKYNDFPTTDYRSGGKFNGYVIEAVVGF